MPLRVPEKIAFLEAEITSLRSRIGGAGNAVQQDKMEMLKDIRDDYQQSVDTAARRAAAKQEAA